MQRTQQCQHCFTEYWWDGTVNNSNLGIVDPVLALNTTWNYATWNKSAGEISGQKQGG
jgi:hypothetical protein